MNSGEREPELGERLDRLGVRDEPQADGPDEDARGHVSEEERLTHEARRVSEDGRRDDAEAQVLQEMAVHQSFAFSLPQVGHLVLPLFALRTQLPQ